MPSSIKTTAGASDANSYATLAEAVTYFGDRLQKDAWLNAAASEKTAALLWATKLLDTRIDWQGNKATTTQALAWPREEVPDKEQDDDDALTAYLSSTTIPQFLKDAQCEFALALLNGDTTIDPDTVGIDAVQIGSLSVRYNAGQKPAVLPRPVRDLTRPYGTPTTGNPVAQLIRG